MSICRDRPAFCKVSFFTLLITKTIICSPYRSYSSSASSRTIPIAIAQLIYPSCSLLYLSLDVHYCSRHNVLSYIFAARYDGHDFIDLAGAQGLRRLIKSHHLEYARVEIANVLAMIRGLSFVLPISWQCTRLRGLCRGTAETSAKFPRTWDINSESAMGKPSHGRANERQLLLFNRSINMC